MSQFYFNDILFIHFLAFAWAILSSIIAIFVYFKNRKSMLNRLWASVSMSVSLWCFGAYLLLTSQDYTKALFAARFLHFFAIPIPVAQLHFTYFLLSVPRNQRRFLWSGYFVTIVLLLSDFTPFFIREVITKSYFRYYAVPGLFYHVFTFVYFGVSIYWSYLLIKAIPSLTSWKRNQVKYVAIASIIGIFGGGTTFPLVYNIPFPPFPALLVALYPLIITYAIVKYRLMDIKLARQYLAMNFFYGVVASAIFITLAFFLRQWFWGIAVVIFLAILLGPYFHRRMTRFLEPAFLGGEIPHLAGPR